MMQHRRYISLICLASSFFSAAAQEDLAVIGYLPTWAMEKVAEDSFSKLTDLILFSAQINEDGSFPDEPVPEAMIGRLHTIQDKHGLSIHLCWGGWGRSQGFSAMATAPKKRAAFIQKLTHYCQENKIHGVDYDWEFPKSKKEKEAYDALIKETAQAFVDKGLLLSMALGWRQGLSEKAVDALDRIHLMTYDMGKRHATFSVMKRVLERHLRKEVPAQKLMLGLPFYGRKIANPSQSLGYADIVRQFKPKREEDEAGGYYFNGPESIAEKVAYAKEKQLGGVMIWEISADSRGQDSLLESIKQAKEAAPKKPGS